MGSKVVASVPKEYFVKEDNLICVCGSRDFEIIRTSFDVGGFSVTCLDCGGQVAYVSTLPELKNKLITLLRGVR